MMTWMMTVSACGSPVDSSPRTNFQRYSLPFREFLFLHSKHLQIIGNSKFIESSDGAFDLTVQKIYHQVDLKNVDSALEQSLEPAETADAQTSREGINIALLHKILKSFGGVRSFTFNRQDVDNEDVCKFLCAFQGFAHFQ